MVLFPVLVLLMSILYVMRRNTLVEPPLRIFTADWFRNRKERKGHGGLAIHERIRLYSSDGRPVIINEAQEMDLDAVREYNLVQELLHAAASGRASEVDVVPYDEQAGVRFVVDGVVVDQPSLSAADADTIIQYIKDKAGLKPEDRQNLQRGKISIDIAGSPVDMEVATAPAKGGQRMRIRVIQELAQTNVNMLGLDEKMIARLDELMTGHGILLVAGPPHSGVTSTEYSLLKKQDPYMRLLSTVESTKIVDLENITQQEYGDAANLSKQLASAMRRDPDVLMVDQAPDPTTAVQVCDYAKQKYIIVGIHAKDSFAALARWLKTVGNVQAGLADVRGVLAQVLIRKLCPDCKEPYPPEPQLLQKLKLPPERVGQFYRPPTIKPKDKDGEIIPCQTCKDSGYYGRTGVFELLVVDDLLKQVMTSGPTLEKMKAAGRKNGMRFLQEQAILKVVAGETSLEEVVRVANQLQKK
jgi:type II secretory ATPase GspE/PulE/Tfp pilus assembly ATPase PilB-like protein